MKTTQRWASYFILFT